MLSSLSVKVAFVNSWRRHSYTLGQCRQKLIRWRCIDSSPTKIIRIKGEIKAPNATATPVKPVQGPVSSPAE